MHLYSVKSICKLKEEDDTGLDKFASYHHADGTEPASRKFAVNSYLIS